MTRIAPSTTPIRFVQRHMPVDCALSRVIAVMNGFPMCHGSDHSVNLSVRANVRIAPFPLVRFLSAVAAYVNVTY
jgi:hypothetical protein